MGAGGGAPGSGTRPRPTKGFGSAGVASPGAAGPRFGGGGAARQTHQPAEKAHARLRPGDVLTLALGSPERGTIKVWRVLLLAERRGPPAEARGLYEDLSGQP